MRPGGHAIDVGHPALLVDLPVVEDHVVAEPPTSPQVPDRFAGPAFRERADPPRPRSIGPNGKLPNDPDHRAEVTTEEEPEQPRAYVVPSHAQQGLDTHQYGDCHHHASGEDDSRFPREQVSQGPRPSDPPRFQTSTPAVPPRRKPPGQVSHAVHIVRKVPPVEASVGAE